MNSPSHKKYLFFTLLIIYSLTQNCGPSLQNDQMLAGNYVFKISSSRIQCYNTTIPLNAIAPLQLIHGISKMDNLENTNFGYDFSFRGRIDTISKLLSFSLFVNNGTFNSISINYILISNRNEYIAGTYIADTLDCNTQQTALIAIPINPQILPNPSSNLAILVFINGIRTQSWIFNLKFQQPLIEAGRTQINVTVVIDAIQPIETLFLSYLIIDINRLSQSYTFSFTTNPVVSDFNLIGILSFTNTSSPIQYAYININKTNNLACEGWNCSACLSNFNCISQGGIVFQGKCLKCGLNSIFNSQTGCVDCGVNATTVNGRCNCKNGFFNISGTCQNCPPGTNYNENLKVCNTICAGGQQWISGACSCSSGTYLINGLCSTCPIGYSYNSTTSTCIIICSSNQVNVNNQCQCSPGFSLVNGVCQVVSTNPSTQTSTTTSTSIPTNSPGIVCSANQYILSGACKCFSEFVQYQGNCLKCPQNSRVTSDQRGCVCNDGFVLLSGTKSCTAKQSSSSNSINTGSSTSSSATSQSSIPSSSTNSNSNSLSSTTSTSNIPSNLTPSTTSTASTISSTTSAPPSSVPSSQPSTLSSTSTSSSASASTSGFGSGLISTSSQTSSSQSASSGSISLLTSGCTPYCDLCISSSICLNCNPYFYLNKTVISNYYSSSCLETCGDGRRFTLPCDDGNTINGDGCSTNCNIEQGWQCAGGSSSNKDICKPNSLTKIVLVNNIVLTNAAYQNVLVSNLPSSLYENGGCQRCSSILIATLLQGPAQTIFRIDLVPSSYDLTKREVSFVITIITPAQSKSNIKFRVALNQTMASYFSQLELNQQVVGTIIFATPQLQNVALASPSSPADPALPSTTDPKTSSSSDIPSTPPSNTPTKSTVIPTQNLLQDQQIIIPDVKDVAQDPLISV